MRLENEDATALFAKNLALSTLNNFPENKAMSFWLIGDLGAGKTSFTRHFLRAMGYAGKVKSPTYNLCEPYEIKKAGKRLNIHHFDLYRMNHPQEWEEAGFRDTLTNPGLSLIEWPEKAEGTLPQPDLIIHIEYMDENSRKISIEAISQTGNFMIQNMVC